MKASLQKLFAVVSILLVTACAEKNFDAQSTQDASSTPDASTSLNPAISGSSGSMFNPPVTGGTTGSTNTGSVNPGSTSTGGSSGTPPAATDRLDQFILELYSNMFNRRDQPGYVYWMAVYRRGEMGCRSLTLSFLLSQEAAGLRSRAISDVNARWEYVQLLYLAVLNRPADQASVSFWANSGYSVIDLENAFLDSSEFRARCQSYGLRY